MIVTNLLTYSPVEAGILAAASINAAMYPWNVASSTLIENEPFFPLTIPCLRLSQAVQIFGNKFIGGRGDVQKIIGLSLRISNYGCTRELSFEEHERSVRVA